MKNRQWHPLAPVKTERQDYNTGVMVKKTKSPEIISQQKVDNYSAPLSAAPLSRLCIRHNSQVEICEIVIMWEMRRPVVARRYL